MQRPGVRSCCCFKSVPKVHLQQHVAALLCAHRLLTPREIPGSLCRYVRHTTTHSVSVPYVNGCGPNTTIGREQPPPPEKHRFSFGGMWPGSHKPKKKQ